MGNLLYDFAINGLELSPNATRIQTHKRNTNFYDTVLRQSVPVGRKTGSSQVVASVELAFPNRNEINNKLRVLIAHFKISPFVQIDSKFILNAAFPDDQQESNFAATLSNLSVYSRPGEPESLYVNLDLIVFNYLPYSPHFNFKNETSKGPSVKKTYEKVPHISKSNLYAGLLLNVLSSIPTISAETNHSLSLEYNEYTRATPPKASGLSNEDTSLIGKNLFSSDSQDIINYGSSSKLHRSVTQNVKTIARLYKSKILSELPVANMFLPATFIDFFYDESDKDALNDHRAGLAFDFALYQKGSISDADLKKLYLQDSRYKILVEIAKDYGFTPHSKYPWHFSAKAPQGSSTGEIVAENHTVKTGPNRKENIIENDNFIKDYQSFLSQMKSKGWLPTDADNIFRKPIVENIIEGNGDVVITSINTALTNNITSIPIVGYEYPTHQYLGGKHARVVFSLEGHRGGQIERIKRAANTVNKNEKRFHRVSDGNTFKISNPIVDLLGVTHVLVDDSESSTVPGSPDTDIFVISATQHDPFFREAFNQERIQGSDDIKTKVFSLIKKKLESGPIREVYTGDGGEFEPLDMSVPLDPQLLRATGVSAFGSALGDSTRGVRPKYSTAEERYNAAFANHLSKVSSILNRLIIQLRSSKTRDIGNLYGLANLVLKSLPKVSDNSQQDASETFTTINPFSTRNAKDTGFKPEPTLTFGRPTGANVFGEAFEGEQLGIRDNGPRDVLDAYSLLSNEFWRMFNSGALLIDEFKSIKSELLEIEKRSLVPCYPDLNLPATETGNPIDTDPGFFFWNEDTDTGYFKKFILSETSEIARDLIPLASSLEQHIVEGDLRADPQRKEKVELAPYDGNSVSPAVNGHKRPLAANKSDQYFTANKVTKEQGFDRKSLNDIYNSLVGDAKDSSVFNMSRAFPTFKIYFIEEDTDEEFDLIPKHSFDDFFSYNAVHDIKIIRSRKVPADLCILSMSNSAGKLTDKVKYNTEDLDKFFESHVASDRDSASENPIDALMLRPGQRLQVRLGYSNNPEKLDIVFNGNIVEVNGGSVVQIVCQSFATELVQNIKGTSEVDEYYSAKDKVTAGIINNLMQSPEVIHFGTKSKSALYRHIVGSPADPESSGNTLYGPNLNPRDDNIFAPNVDTYVGTNSLFDPWGPDIDISPWKATLAAGEWALTGATVGALTPTALVTTELGAGIGAVGGFAANIVQRYTNLDYKVFNTTIWDVLKEMELRHPGWVAAPVPYGDRMTLFFGVPDMPYWHRPDRQSELIDNAPQRAEFEKSEPSSARLLAAEQLTTGIPSLIVGVDETGKETHELRKKLESKRFKPFRKHHFMSDQINIVANNISCSTDVYNAVTVQYVNSADDTDNEGKHTTYETDNVFTLKVDEDIRDENVKVLFSQQPNCIGEFMATRYAQGLLLRHLKDVYSGSITVLGNPKIKPYDTCHVYDSTREMYGPVEVEQVVHHFSAQTGFITEVIPDLCVSGNEVATLPLSQAMGLLYYTQHLAAGALLVKPVSGALASTIFGGTRKASVVGEYASALNTIRTESGIFAAARAGGSAFAGAASGKIAGTTASMIEGLSSLTMPGGTKAALKSTFVNTMKFSHRIVGKAGWLAVPAIVVFGLTSYYVKITKKRQPILIHPLMVNGVPFIAGIEGFKQDTLFSAMRDRFGLGIEKGKGAWNNIRLALLDVFVR